MARKAVAIEEAEDVHEVATERNVIITIPLGQPPINDYEGQQAASGRVNLQQKSLHLQAQLGPEAATIFIRIRNGLRDRNEKLAGDGRPVWSNVDALRWIMEKIASEVG